MLNTIRSIIPWLMFLAVKLGCQYCVITLRPSHGLPDLPDLSDDLLTTYRLALNRTTDDLDSSSARAFLLPHDNATFTSDSFVEVHHAEEEGPGEKGPEEDGSWQGGSEHGGRRPRRPMESPQPSENLMTESTPHEESLHLKEDPQDTEKPLKDEEQREVPLDKGKQDLKKDLQPKDEIKNSEDLKEPKEAIQPMASLEEEEELEEEEMEETGSPKLKATRGVQRHEYCVVGAGPAGLQMGHLLQKAGRDYAIFEKSNQSGSFFVQYPRHGRLISINKRETGRTNPEFNMRHDWNSLLSDHPELSFKKFSSVFFPPAETMVHYLNEYTQRLGLNVQYNTEIQDIRLQQQSFTKANSNPSDEDSETDEETTTKTEGKPERSFRMKDQLDNLYFCRFLVVATGLALPNKPTFPGHHLVLGYEDISVNASGFTGKKVLILGRGNAAFETADAIYGSTSVVHMVSRSRARLAWNTHYVGDLRAVNNGLLDTYQLKSLDGLLEASVEDMVLEKRGELIHVHFPWDTENATKGASAQGDGTSPFPPTGLTDYDNFSLREGYDHVIRCLGFKFDFDIFHASAFPGSSDSATKYPDVKHSYEARQVPGLYFAGTATHSLDYKKSSGGFIHGFRYTVRVLHRLLEWQHHGVPWPTTTHGVKDLVSVVVKRINEADGSYQMFGVLADILLFEKDGQTFRLLREFPVRLLARLQELTGHKASKVVVVLMEYGPDFSGPDKDTFRSDRATGDPLDAHRSNFLHPVFYLYRSLPTESQMLQKWRSSPLPRPDHIHHVLEDFLTVWTAQQSHILPLRRFFEQVLGHDLKNRYDRTCLRASLLHARPPAPCNLTGFAKGRGVSVATLTTAAMYTS